MARVDEERIGRMVEIQNALSRLTPEQLEAFDAEGRWIRKQIAAGRIPSPEKLFEKAPIIMRLLANLGYP